jgi:hypothetical protein
MSFLWKDLRDGRLVHKDPAPTREELFDRSSLRERKNLDLTKPIDDRWLIVKVRMEGGKWVEEAEESEPDRIWRLLVGAASS